MFVLEIEDSEKTHEKLEVFLTSAVKLFTENTWETEESLISAMFMFLDKSENSWII